MISLLVFFAILSVLIIVHEFGHLIVAKITGVRVEKFSLGFGPKIFSKMYKGTNYILSLIPMGGYVKMAGDNRDEHSGKPDEYLSKSPGLRMRIILFGPVLNYILAFLCLCIVYLIGYPSLSTKVSELMDGYPAIESGLLAGDQIIQVDKKPVRDWEELQQAIRDKKTKTKTIVVLRDNKELYFTINVRIEKLKNIFGKEEEIQLIGIKPNDELIFLKYNFWQAIVMGFKKLIMITDLTFKSLYRIITGSQSLKDSVTGPLGIFYITQRAAQLGINSLLHVVAILSASLAIFNILPLPVLDGGHIIFLFIEKIKGKPFSQKTEEVINRLGFSFILLLAMFVFYSDLIKFGIMDKLINWFSDIKF